MARARKAEGERRVTIPTSTLSNETPEQLLRRFRQAYCWHEGHVPSEQEVRQKARELHEVAILGYIEAAEADERAKML